MTEKLHRMGTARELPDAWDALARSRFQRRAMLRHAEEHNPCAQRYWLLERDGRPAAGAVVYTLPLDLLTFAGLPSPLRMQVVGLPYSVGWPGLLGEGPAVAALVAGLAREERGLLVGLNLDAPLPVAGLRQGRTLPTVVLRRRFASFDDYLASLASPYRRRLRRLMEPFADVETETGPCHRYDGADHALYLAVLGRSRAKLERLAEPFFRHLPEGFTLTRYRLDGGLVGWHLCAAGRAATPGAEAEPFTFFLGGVDYRRNRELNGYFNLLVGVLREGIEAGAEAIDFGQTAEVPKTRLGGRSEEKHLFAWHRNPLARGLLGLGRGLLEYRIRVPQTHVFRTEPAA